MQLKLKRSQREGGVVSKTVVFCLDARAEFSASERRNIDRYKLAKTVIYNSEASKRHLANFDKKGAGVSGLASLALASMSLNITIESLQRGQHIECKTMEELLGAEEQLLEACKNLKSYLDIAATFDGREILFTFEDDGPTVSAVAASPTPQLLLEPSPEASSPSPVEEVTYEPAAEQVFNTFSRLEKKRPRFPLYFMVESFVEEKLPANYRHLARPATIALLVVPTLYITYLILDWLVRTGML